MYVSAHLTATEELDSVESTILVGGTGHLCAGYVRRLDRPTW